jgi:hypothetical protein
MTAAGTPCVVVLAEHDYRYGVGVLRLRVEAVEHAATVRLDNDDWVPVSGTRLRSDGLELHAVQVFVRVSRLPGNS